MTPTNVGVGDAVPPLRRPTRRTGDDRSALRRRALPARATKPRSASASARSSMRAGLRAPRRAHASARPRQSRPDDPHRQPDRKEEPPAHADLRTPRIRGPRLLPLVARPSSHPPRATPWSPRTAPSTSTSSPAPAPSTTATTTRCSSRRCRSTSASNGFIHALDMSTTTKRTFMERFEEVILEPRDLEYKLQFPGPTGTNAVEAALKLARKVTGRDRVVGFTNGFHGMTLGSLVGHRQRHEARRRRRPARQRHLDALRQLPRRRRRQPPRARDDARRRLERPRRAGRRSSSRPPRARAASTPPAPSGCAASTRSARRHGILLIVDDIQVGCGRTGPFFSWEEMGIDPDIVTPVEVVWPARACRWRSCS